MSLHTWRNADDLNWKDQMLQGFHLVCIRDLVFLLSVLETKRISFWNAYTPIKVTWVQLDNSPVVMLGAKEEPGGQRSRAEERRNGRSWGVRERETEGYSFFLKSLMLTLAEDKTKSPLQTAYTVERE